MCLMNRLKELRRKNGLTQQELANEIGVTKLSVSNWENGKHEIKSDKAQALADYFGVSVGYLLGYETERQRLIKTRIFEGYMIPDPETNGFRWCGADEQLNAFIRMNPCVEVIDIKYQANVSYVADGGVSATEYYQGLCLIYKQK